MITRVGATRVGVITSDWHSTYRERTCIRCGVKVEIPERQASVERKNRTSTHDFRCDDCRPVRFFG